jgi:CHAT domain-containing protein
MSISLVDEMADALREASLTVLRERRAKNQSTLPFYWAAFVAVGDWRWSG